jgi:hypothetical protein
MMAKQSEIFELTYDASRGVLPTAANGWRRFANPWNNQFGIGIQKITDGVLNLYNGHSYERQGYYPIEHDYAMNCEMSVIFTNSLTTNVIIHLTDGVESAMGIINQNTFRVGVNNIANYLRKYQTNIVLKDINTFRVVKKGSKAEYYLNDELLYAQTDLYSISEISIGGAGTEAVGNNNGYILERINAISFGCDGYIDVLGFTYKEW